METKPSIPNSVQGVHAESVTTAGGERRRAAFTVAMIELCRATAKATKGEYNPTRLLDSINEVGGVDAAKSAIHGPVPYGFTRLYKKGLLTSSVEALVLRKEWSDLFTDEDREAAYDRLKKHDFEFPPGCWDPTSGFRS